MAETRIWIARVFTFIEDVVYVGLGLLLAASAITLLIWSVMFFIQEFSTATVPGAIIGMLDRMLLVLLIVELLYTVQVSFREHSIVPEPFLLVGVIAVIRRVLVITAEFAHGIQGAAFQQFIIELGVLTVLILVLVISLILLRKREPIAAERA